MTELIASSSRVPASPAVLAYASELGTAVERVWGRHRFHVGAFPEVAYQCLSDVEVPTDLTARAILSSVANWRDIVQQEDPRSIFGHPPITLWRGRDFYVSALYWLDGTPSIHQHGFSGAFRVLAGGSLHTPYTFSVGEEITHRLILGELKLDRPELLQIGDVRAIEPGNRFIHGLFHLERPSVTIVVRTYGQPTGQPQFSYFHPGVGFDPYYRDSRLDRRFECVMTLAELDGDAGVEAACELIADEDLWAGFLLAMRWAVLVDRERGLNRLLEFLERTHGHLTAPLVQSFDAERRAMSIMTRRRLLHDPEHRLLLALLLNLPDRRAIDAIVHQRYPDADVGALLARWVTELAGPEMRGISGFVLDPTATDAVVTSLRAGDSARLADLSVDNPLPSLLKDLFR